MPRLRRNSKSQPAEESSDSSSGEESSHEEEEISEEESSQSSSSDSSSSSSGGSDYDDDFDHDGDEDDESYNHLEDALDALIDSAVDYEDPNECWDLVREWLREHSIEETKGAVEIKGEFDTTALHVACRNRPPVDVVEIMLMAAPDMIFWADSFGWLPLHYACANGTEIEVAQSLLDAYPDSKLTTDKRGRTPLHFALGNVENPPTPALVILLAGKSGESAKWPDENEMLPIHYACAYGATVEVLTVLIHAWEESMQKIDAKGRTPLHFACGNADRENSPKVVKLLLELSPGRMDQMDAEKNLPLHLLSTKAESVEESKFHTRDTIQKCLDIYLKANPKTSIEFLTGIQKMPEWLREIAVIHPTVQTMLNTKISSRFPTMILMLDFYFLAAVIGTFSITSRESLERRYNPLNESNSSRSVSGALLSPLFIGALYFLGREITQMISVRSQTTVLAYVLDPENMLNLAFVFFTLYHTILMLTGMGNDDRFRYGAAFTMGLCYLSVLAYLKSILIDFAVFVSGVVYVTTRLVAFLVCLMITVLAFAQMWYTLFRQSSECALAAEGEDGGGGNETTAVPTDDTFYYYADEPQPEEVEDCEPSLDYPFCHSLWFSIYKTYTMMLGEIDDTIFYWNTLSLVMFCIFFFAEVIVLLNILVAIITDLYSVVTNERASIVFWSNRLAFITDMDMVTNGPWKKTVMNLFKLRDDDDDDEDDEEDTNLVKKDKVEISWERILWKKLIECFDPEVDSNGMGMILYVPLRVFVSMFLIPFWLLLGILSAGWLWPPQVREGLFVQKVSAEDAGEANEMEKRIEEVIELKKDLRTVQQHLVGQFIEDRKDMTALKDQVINIKRELKEEMKNIKGVMTSLFEVQQQTMIS
mmetsp:Transcript_16091/g.34795  ORF Transcript_16091/g.34795 Transcript_16091/m.34795 type:complete len:875 (-) Transcript_16091:338-2962(-)|eukprot:CAMPEP_0172324814 /NCGR_PEP_ID=MMETSP1058-20130122/52404_1 /TAXON_ID=83371 /ORGANISM="Detonula confervacea, Strain CCMP 353" /LENGTH=874 /DNA_ID=CAMNT_0013041211 /DNA_START=180 /DNA_END=2804 /DNA_ORIENTATION=+